MKFLALIFAICLIVSTGIMLLFPVESLVLFIGEDVLFAIILEWMVILFMALCQL